MNTFEFKSLFDLLQAFPTEQSCIEYLELCRWKNGIVSPYDPASKVYNYGGGKYRCKNTGLNFNVGISKEQSAIDKVVCGDMV